MKCRRDTDGRKLDHALLQTMRIQSVKAVERGERPADVARASGVNTRSVSRWLADYAERGQRASQAKPIPGRPPILTTEHSGRLAGAVRTIRPLQRQFEFSLRTLELIVEFLERLVHDIDGPTFPILDKLSVHKHKCAREFVAAQIGSAKLCVLPPSAPHVNPDEHVWGNVKARVAKQTLTNKPRLNERLTQGPEQLHALPQTIAGFFGQSQRHYILDAMKSA
jgi:transposase